jgi:large subunit ribosomal protein L25
VAEVVLLAEPGRPVGSRSARRLRADGRVPAVVYGQGVEPVPVTVHARDLRTALSTDAGLNAVLSLRVDGKKYLTMARELQRHPVRGTVIHVDFQVVDPERQISAEVPISLTGEAVELHRSEGVLDQQLFALPVMARPADIPTHLEVDVSEVVIGSVIRVEEIALPPGVTSELDPESIVVAGQPPRVQEAEAAEAAAEAEAGAAPAEAAAGEGEARGAQAASAGGEGAGGGGSGEG